MRRERFENAMQLLKPPQWRAWEETASVFLTDEFPDLKPMASPGGDQGRDGELWQPEGDASVMLQYSVTPEWRAKIIDTAQKIAKNFNHVNILIYATNHEIGAAADDLRKKLRQQYRLALDVRDRSWFLDRMHRSTPNQEAAKRLSEIVVDPVVADETNITRNKGQSFSDYETDVAFIYLNLQLEDDAQDKGLTRVCFESLVRAALRHTTPTNRLGRKDIQSRVAKIFPDHIKAEVIRYVDSALIKMTKKQVRHWTQEDEFCLSNDERNRLADRLAMTKAADSALADELQQTLRDAAQGLSIKLPTDTHGVLARMKRVLEAVLLERGELFVSHFTAGKTHLLTTDDLRRITIRDIKANPERTPLSGNVVELVETALNNVLTIPSSRTHSYLRGLSNAYTVLAFLKQTPDVQSTVVKMFSEGEIWLDTNIALRLLAESLLNDESLRQYTILLKAAVDAGLTLRITPGVLEEVDRHFNKSLTFFRATQIEWRGNVPFMFSAFIWSGQLRSEFPSWVEQFRGAARPEEDIAEYLDRVFRILVGSLREDYEKAPQNTRAFVQEYWRGVHDRRKTSEDPMTGARLADHDAENFLGVLERRRSEPPSPMGYKTWWLTLDSAAFGAAEEISKTSNIQIRSPALSPDFLTSYLSVGPLRRMLTKGTESALPLMMDLTMLDAVPPELLKLAEQHRSSLRALPEHVRRRRIRDMLDATKERPGVMAREGTTEMERRFKQLFEADTKRA